MNVLSFLNTGLDPVLFVLDPQKRVYWLFMLSSAAVALLLGLLRKQSAREALAPLLSPSVWLHRSSIQDFVWLFFNHVFWLLLIVPVLGASLSLSIQINRILIKSFGAGNFWQLDPIAMSALYTVVLFLLEDFTRFFLHFLYHKVPLLWRFHAVHHSAEVLTPITLYRIHWLELTLNSIRSFLVIGVGTAVFMYLFKNALNFYDILGVSVFNFLFNLAASNLRHSSIWLGFGVFENLFISPAQHQIHHSNVRAHFDKNFGACLSVWDRLFGSFLKSQGQRVDGFGLSKEGELKHYSFVKSFWGIKT